MDKYSRSLLELSYAMLGSEMIKVIYHRLQKFKCFIKEAQSSLNELISNIYLMFFAIHIKINSVIWLNSWLIVAAFWSWTVNTVHHYKQSQNIYYNVPPPPKRRLGGILVLSCVHPSVCLTDSRLWTWFCPRMFYNLSQNLYINYLSSEDVHLRTVSLTNCKS